jgi:hypothetical protein
VASPEAKSTEPLFITSRLFFRIVYLILPARDAPQLAHLTVQPAFSPMS